MVGTKPIFFPLAGPAGRLPSSRRRAGRSISRRPRSDGKRPSRVLGPAAHRLRLPGVELSYWRTNLGTLPGSMPSRSWMTRTWPSHGTGADPTVGIPARSVMARPGRDPLQHQREDTGTSSASVLRAPWPLLAPPLDAMARRRTDWGVIHRCPITGISASSRRSRAGVAGRPISRRRHRPRARSGRCAHHASWGRGGRRARACRRSGAPARDAAHGARW
jgi:hypothetical protein